MIFNKIFSITLWIKKNVTKILEILIYRIIPFLALFALYLSISDWGSFVFSAQRWLWWMGYNLFIFLILIKPISVILQKYFKAKNIRLIDFFWTLSFWNTNPYYRIKLISNLIYSLSNFIIGLRRPLWILTFWLVFFHFILFEIRLYHIWSSDFLVFSNPSLLFWLIGVIILLVAFAISNNASMKILGKYWKYIQQLLYIAFIWAALHIAFIKWEWFSNISLIVVFIILKYFEWKKQKNNNLYQQSTSDEKQQYRCNPCWYIYDENVGDPDWGIAPGTKFEDIPESRVCPVCGVGKSQFTLVVKRESSKSLHWSVISKTLLNSSVLELKISLSGIFDIIPWQAVNILLDNDGKELQRTYSIANYYYKKNNTLITLLIKLNKESISSSLLLKLVSNQKIKIDKPFGSFQLQNTNNPKVFIATGTWLAPIYAMIKSLSYFTKFQLYFGVSYQKDLFYQQNIESIKNNSAKIFLSRENISWYNYGRIDISKENFDINTEFYICGNPAIIKDTKDVLTKKWFKNIYFEQF